jgi:uncharacterized glyoxalase superfamily protein PhnB
VSGSVVPSLRYADAHAAIRLLTDGFGFSVNLLVENDAGRVEHAQLVHGTGMVMLGSEPLPGEDRLEMDLGSSALYVVLPADTDVDAHATAAEAAGATIVLAPSGKDYGGRDYTCRDPEGTYWSFGTYDPWAAPTP